MTASFGLISLRLILATLVYATFASVCYCICYELTVEATITLTHKF